MSCLLPPDLVPPFANIKDALWLVRTICELCVLLHNMRCFSSALGCCILAEPEQRAQYALRAHAQVRGEHHSKNDSSKKSHHACTITVFHSLSIVQSRLISRSSPPRPASSSAPPRPASRYLGHPPFAHQSQCPLLSSAADL